MIRTLHLRWGGMTIELQRWKIEPLAIRKEDFGTLDSSSVKNASSLLQDCDLLVLEIPAAPFQEAFFCHRNPLKNLMDLPHTLRLLTLYRRLLRFVSRSNLPFVIFDFQDSSAIPSRFLPLLARAVAYHKRELPRLPVNAFLHTESFAIEPWRNRGRYAQELEKLRPLSMGALCPTLPMPEPLTRDIDVLWGGTVGNSPVRERGVRLLRELQAEGSYNILILEEPVDKENFHGLLNRTRLAFCPDGNGWQCYRTFEAAQLGAVPLMTHPTIWLDEPLRDGEHAVYYEPQGDNLKRAICEALLHHRGLEVMSCATQIFTRQRHNEAAIYGRHTRDALQREVLHEINSR